MADMDTLETSSVADSIGLAWEATKRELDNCRSQQNEQLQSLRGKRVKMPLRKPRAGVKRRALKKLIQKIQRNALRSLKALKCKLKQRVIHSSVKDGYISTMSFKVHHETLTKSQSLEVDSVQTKVRDQSIQTGKDSVENKFSQTSLSVESSTNAQLIHQLPIYVLPSTLQHCIHSSNNCCHSMTIPSCSPKPPPQNQKSDLDLNKDLEEGARSDLSRNLIGKYSLKDICKELLTMLDTKESSKQSPREDNNNDRDHSSSATLVSKVGHRCTETLSEALDPVVSRVNPTADISHQVELYRVVPVEPSKSTRTVPPDLLLHSNAYHAQEKGIVPEMTTELQQYCKSGINKIRQEGTVSLKQKHLETEKGPSDSSTDSLLKNFNTLEEIKGRNSHTVMPSTTVSGSYTKNSFDNVATSPIIESSRSPRHTNSQVEESLNDNVLMPPPNAVPQFSQAETQKKSKHVSVGVNKVKIVKADEKPLNNIPKSEGILKSSGFVKNDPSCECMAPSSDTSKFNSKKCPLHFLKSDQYLSERSKFTCVPEGSLINLNDAGSKQKSSLEMKNIEMTSNYLLEVSSSVGKSEDPELCYLEENSKLPVKEDSPAISQDVNRKAILNSRKESINSPAFEDIDPTEMESVLLIWRQQEQLHQNHEEPVKSATSSRANNLFKKLKKPLDLPPELRHVRILRPPPIQTQCDLNLSALQSLDRETKELALDEDDDVPETSSVPVIETSKKRKLRLKKNSPSPLPVIIHKSEEIGGLSKIEVQSSTQNPSPKNEEGPVQVIGTERYKSDPSRQKEDKEETTENCNVTLTTSTRAMRSSKRLKLSLANVKEKGSSSEYLNPDSKQEKLADEIATKRSRSNKRNKAEKTNKSKDISGQRSNKETLEKQTLENCLNTQNTSVALSEELQDIKNLFTDQIQERVDKLKRQWLQERGKEVTDINQRCSTPVTAHSHSSSPSVATVCSQGFDLSQKKMSQLESIPVTEIGRAHDIVTHILLTSWRGINAKCVTRRFVCPPYDTKAVSKCLWDLRSHCGPEESTERIMALNWKDIHSRALRAMVSMFTLSLARHVPFVIEIDQKDEDDKCSVSSDTDHNMKRKVTPIKVVTTRQIFKGECIEGLNGLLVFVSKKDKEKLKSWNFPKFNQGREWALFGPIVYLKRTGTDYNTQVVIIQGELVGVKASRQIMCGETLVLGFLELENMLYQ